MESVCIWMADKFRWPSSALEGGIDTLYAGAQ